MGTPGAAIRNEATSCVARAAKTRAAHMMATHHAIFQLSSHLKWTRTAHIGAVNAWQRITHRKANHKCATLGEPARQVSAASHRTAPCFVQLHSTALHRIFSASRELRYCSKIMTQRISGTKSKSELALHKARKSYQPA